jgi:hypothetical protein
MANPFLIPYSSKYVLTSSHVSNLIFSEISSDTTAKILTVQLVSYV